MAKVIECGAVVPGSKFVIRGADEAEIIMKMAEHLGSAHDVKPLWHCRSALPGWGDPA